LKTNSRPTRTGGFVSSNLCVLMVERDPSLRGVVHQQLADRSIDVVDDDGQRDVVVLTSRVSPDVVVLELAGYTGTDRLVRLRHVTNVPVIALLDRIVDCVDALEQGADDYLEKPLAPRELVAKVCSALRRVRSDAPPTVFRHGELVVDLLGRHVRLRNQLVPMPVREFDLLAFMAGSPGRAFSRSELLQQVWHVDGTGLGPETVTEHIRRLRQRIEDDPARPRRLQTIRGFGYRFCP